MPAGIFVALLCALLALSAPLHASAATTCPGQNGRIAFAIKPSLGGATIGLIGPTGQVRQLFEPLKPGELLRSPSFSCDGRRIVFGRRISVEYGCGWLESAAVPSGEKLNWAGIRGTRFPPQPAYEPPDGCAWEPTYLTTGQILYGGSFGATPGLYVAGLSGQEPERLFEHYVMASSASGQWFVGEGPATDPNHVYLLNQKGNPVQSLATATIRERDHEGERRGTFFDPSFSPNGEWIAYCRSTVIVPPRTEVTRRIRQRVDIHIVRRDGTHERRLTHNGVSCGPTFSPDGRQIAFVQGGEEEGANLAVLSLKHPSKVRLLTHLGPEVDVTSAPTWAPR